MSEFVINLVFDNFDEDGNPIPNGSNIPTLGATKNDFYWPPFDFNLNQKFYNIEDVTIDKNFYYIISYSTSKLKNILDSTFILSNEAIACCKTKNLKILFVNFQEVNYDEFNVLQQIVKYISYFGLDENNFYYINNNSKLQKYKDILNSKIHVYTSTFLFQLIAERLNKNESFFKPNKEFLFSCHNRLTKQHRITTLCFLKKYNILKNTDWTFTDVNQISHIQTIQFGKITGYFTFIADEIDYFKQIGLKYSKYEIDKINLFKESSGGDITNVVTTECFTNCYINIITETHFDSQEIHASEKSFRAFYFMQLPIFIATYGHVRYLREKFGFDMFDDLIDHSYDSEPNDKNRMILILNEIKRLNDNKDLVIEFYKKNKDRFEKNLNLFQSIYKENQTINLFKKLSNKNIEENSISINTNVDNLNLKINGIKIYHDIIVPNKCGTRYLNEYILLNTNNEKHTSIDINYIWDFPDLNWIVIRHPEEYLASALKTDLLYIWENPKENELDMINRYIDRGTGHYFNNLYKIFYSYALKYKNKKFVFLKNLSDFCLHKFTNKANYKYDSTNYKPMGNIYMDKKTIIEYVKEFYPSQWELIQLNLKKEMFFYNKIIENCIFFDKISHPPIIVKNEEVIKEVIEKNSWLKRIV